MLDFSVWSRKDSLTVHLVNLTNPMMMKGPVRELIPIANQVARIQTPHGRRVKAAKLLVAGAPAPFRSEGNVVVLEVPSIDVHEVIALDLMP